MTHICVSDITIIASDKGLSRGRRQAIIWTNAGILLIWTLGTNFNEILIEVHTFSFKKMHLKMSSAKWRPFCLGLNVLRYGHYGLTRVAGLLAKNTYGGYIRIFEWSVGCSYCLSLYRITWNRVKLWTRGLMTSSNGNIFRVTGHLCGKFTGHRWISHTKASDAELWCLLWSAPEWTVE